MRQIRPSIWLPSHNAPPPPGKPTSGPTHQSPLRLGTRDSQTRAPLPFPSDPIPTGEITPRAWDSASSLSASPTTTSLHSRDLTAATATATSAALALAPPPSSASPCFPFHLRSRRSEHRARRGPRGTGSASRAECYFHSEGSCTVNLNRLTRKKGATKNALGDPANTKTSRQPRRAAQAAASEKKVNDLITSSAKKKKSVGAPSKKNRASKGGRKLISACDAANAENEVSQVVSGIPHDEKQSDDNVDGRPCNSIFSPAYHLQKECGVSNFAKGLEHKGDTLGSVGSVEERTTHAQGRQEVTTIRSESTSHAVKTCVGSDHHTLNAQSAFCNTPLEEDEFSELGNLSSEVSAIYLAMQQSKLECIDEHSQDSISTEGYVDPEDTEEYDDFDPYAFIKDLPDLSLVVPKFRPVLLPKQTRSCPTTTLVLDLDETLVHSTLEPCEDADFAFPVYFNFREHTIYVRCRPYLKEFLERVASLFETIIFTASQSIYAEQLLNVLDPKRKLFRHRVYRDSCVYVEGNYLKDLTVLGRDLTRIMIVDNSPQAFGFQLDNGIPIESWFDDPNDQELLKLLPFLESLVGVEDVRPYIARKFNLREKVATASSLPMDLQI